MLILLGIIIYVIMSYNLAVKAENIARKIEKYSDDIIMSHTIQVKDINVVNTWFKFKERYEQFEKSVGETKAMMCIPIITTSPIMMIKSLMVTLAGNRILSQLSVDYRYSKVSAQYNLSAS